MESLQTLKSRLGAVKNIGQITKAMEVVSATKMRKAQTLALAGRPYAFEALELLGEIIAHAPENALANIPLAETRPFSKTLIVVVTSDRGLAGSFNSQVFRAVEKFVEADIHSNGTDLPRSNSSDSNNNHDKSSVEELQRGHTYEYVAVGKKSLQYLTRKGVTLADSFVGFGDYAEMAEIEPLTTHVIEGFLGKKFDRVVSISTHFRSTLKQETLVRQVLPVSIDKIREVVDEIVPEKGKFSDIGHPDLEKLGTDMKPDYIFEPSALEALSALIPHLIEMQLLHLVLEANASEHSARMVAMKSASDNAKELSVGLQLEYNKARQAGITKEIIEITSTQAALG